MDASSPVYDDPATVEVKAQAVELVLTLAPLALAREPALRKELEGLSVTEIKRRARLLGADQDDLDAIDETPTASSSNVEGAAGSAEIVEPAAEQWLTDAGDEVHFIFK